ncbi:hypothetical protein CEXT_21411 [Caerostris extrusa]|uniref:Uncharacterized protein n=1 Tax=Caerostris extrusa TaxID=172846 RepID=A0AAV4Q5Q8_CAEEX|nr:hypothetical protein CEXT_21411 [Caerostris extrusa]
MVYPGHSGIDTEAFGNASFVLFSRIRKPTIRITIFRIRKPTRMHYPPDRTCPNRQILLFFLPVEYSIKSSALLELFAKMKYIYCTVNIIKVIKVA